MPAAAIAWLAAVLILVVVTWLRLAKPNGLSRRATIWLVLGAALLAGPARLLQGFLLDSLGLSIHAAEGGMRNALLAAMAVLAPVEQAALVLVVWPVHRAFRLQRLGAAIGAGIIVALGYSIVDGGFMLLTASPWPTLIRVILRAAHMVSSCVVWAAAASYDQRHRKHWFALVWILAVAIQGFGNHLALTRSAGFAVFALPLLLAVLMGTTALLRNKPALAATSETSVPSIPPLTGVSAQVGSATNRLSLTGILSERPTIDQIRVAWKHQHRPALLHWIAAGALITLGALFVAIAIAIVVSRRLGVNLSRIEDGDISATGPVMMVGAIVMFAFPVAGYLVALASAADSVFEPGMGALVSIVIVVALLSVASPVSILFALAMAPLAFGLACVGAWFGLQRPRS